MASRSPKMVREAATSCMDANTTFVQADPATFRALVQKLTGAPGGTPAEKQEVVMTVAHAPPPRRPKLQERRRAVPARLELTRRQSFYYHHHHGLVHSPVSPMDAYLLASSSSSPSLSSSSSMSPSTHSSSSCGVVISKEEEEREEKAIASKGFYLHSSPRSGGDGERPKLLPLFPVHSPRSYFAS
ncbi:VQ motif-containing protein 11 [Phragmites australis]|uniref:VQ motif-containing protein 11 n=1 Tax=Phragmites australis TaxID=29695 RepID=UPI002D7823D9|nr:VQ motif-containing protein 11 [Phragmites australis]